MSPPSASPIPEDQGISPENPAPLDPVNPAPGLNFLTKPLAVRNYLEIFLRDNYRTLSFGPKPPPKSEGFSADMIWESCLVRGVFSGVAGGGMGLLMGGFFHTMQPLEIDEKLSTMQQIKRSYKGFGASCKRMSGAFAKFGLVYSTVECFIERERAAHDVTNAILGGCITGAALAWQAGPQAMAIGCGGVAAFSAIIEKVMFSDH
jgi:import inner membrane translocase subunit TIM22